MYDPGCDTPFHTSTCLCRLHRFSFALSSLYQCCTQLSSWQKAFLLSLLWDWPMWVHCWRLKKNLICCSLVRSIMRHIRRKPCCGQTPHCCDKLVFFIIQKGSQGCIWFLSLIMERVKDVIVWQLIKGHSGAGYLPLVLLFTCSVFDPRLTLLLALSSICWSSPVKSVWMWFLPGLLSHL